MSDRNVIEFLRTLATQADLLLLVVDLIPSFTEADFDAAMAGGAKGP